MTKNVFRLFLVGCFVFASIIASADRRGRIGKGTVTLTAADQTPATAEWPVVSPNHLRKVTANSCTGTPCTQYET